MNTTTCISILRSCMLNVLTIPLKGRISPLTVNLCMPTVPLELRGVSDACAVCKRISSMKALQLGCGLVKSTNFYWSIFETEIWAFPHKETARSICLGRLLHCGQLEPRWTPCAFDNMQYFAHGTSIRNPPWLELYAPILWRIQLATFAHTRSQTFSFLVGTRLAKTSPRYFPKTIFVYCKHEWVGLALMFVANQYIAQLMHYYWFPFQSKTIRDLLSVPNHSFTWLRAESFITSTAIEIFLGGFLSYLIMNENIEILTMQVESTLHLVKWYAVIFSLPTTRNLICH